MNKPLTFLLALTFLFLFSGSVYAQETDVKKEFYDSGKLKSEFYYKNGKIELEAKVSTQFTLLDALMEMEENLKEEKL
jgi:antitoxin component YwqK of YwqJK toxin-antitoxin module